MVAVLQKQLIKIAKSELRIHTDLKDWYLPMNKLYRVGSGWHFGPDLYKLACQLKGTDRLAGQEVLSIFFCSEAVSLLLTMPNLYWFWTVVYDATMRESLDAERIGIKALQLAVRDLRNAAARYTDLRRKIEDLTQVQACAWVASGFILVEKTGEPNQVKLVRNPIFQPSEPV